jgi:hypothetical protein
VILFSNDDMNDLSAEAATIGVRADIRKERIRVETLRRLWEDRTRPGSAALLRSAT